MLMGVIMNISNEDKYAYIFKKYGIGKCKNKELCKLFQNYETIINLDIEKVIDFRFKEYEIYNNIASIMEPEKLNEILVDIRKNKTKLLTEAEEYYKMIIDNGVNWTHLTREDYPKNLYNIVDPPSILFYKGRLPDDNKPSVAMIGARQCSLYGKQVAKAFAKDFASEDIQVISGLARGIDGISQQTAVDYDGATFGVLGCGVNVVYPPENTELFDEVLKRGGLISEFEFDELPIRRYFPSRNRIISGLSDAVVVVEARKKSGTLITVSQALEQGRDVFAVPGRITDGLSDGCNFLLANGAGIAISSESVINELRNNSYKYSESICETNNLQFIFNQNDEDRISKSQIEDEDDNDDLMDKSLDELIMHYLDQGDLGITDLVALLYDKHHSYEDILTTLMELEVQGAIMKIGPLYRKV
jgi:DNA processing protein